MPVPYQEGLSRAEEETVGRSPLIPLISTKLHAPRVAQYADRPRLGAHLDHVLDDAVRLTLLSAPPGYGKSAAVAGWLESRGTRSAWLSLDAADNDPVRFLRYFAAALAPLRPGVDRLTPALLDEDA